MTDQLQRQAASPERSVFVCQCRDRQNKVLTRVLRLLLQEAPERSVGHSQELPPQKFKQDSIVNWHNGPAAMQLINDIKGITATTRTRDD